MRNIIVIFIILLVMQLANAANCFGARINDNTNALKAFAEQAVEVNRLDAEREEQLKNNTWKNPSPGQDPNEQMHKSSIKLVMP